MQYGAEKNDGVDRTKVEKKNGKKIYTSANVLGKYRVSATVIVMRVGIGDTFERAA